MRGTLATLSTQQELLAASSRTLSGRTKQSAFWQGFAGQYAVLVAEPYLAETDDRVEYSLNKVVNKAANQVR